MQIKYPDLTPNELKLCALTKLNLNIKETASLLNISPNSVKVARYRLKKRMGLSQDQSLTTFFANLI
ncbi:MAG: hypothetical protein HC831_11285 [Chloroflexia bacterium]|nr:hypothetical protein [Chloroflexia bacterium]